VKFKLTARAAALAFAALLALAAAPARAQEEEGVPVVLDEPVVQVNNDVVMLSTLTRELREFKDSLVKQRGMTEQQADDEIEKRRPEIIFNLITEALLIQKGKDTPGMTERIEAEVNREMLRVCREQNLTTLERCEEAMRAEGINPEEIRQTLRSQFMRQAILQQEVDSKVYFSFTDADLRKYHESHREKFQSVTLSEIFLSSAGRKPEEVRARAAQLVAQARGGADFGALAEAHSEREVGGERMGKKSKGRIEGPDGKLRWFLVSELLAASPSVGAAIKPLKAGEVTDPVQSDEGFVFFKVHERDVTYNENQVRGAMLADRGGKDREAYVASLRRDAFIKVAPKYRDAVQPLLDKDRTTAASAEGDAKDKKGGGKQ
jgi:parvulin-like peptidyl-prolyl isomerase